MSKEVYRSAVARSVRVDGKLKPIHASSSKRTNHREENKHASLLTYLAVLLALALGESSRRVTGCHFDRDRRRPEGSPLLMQTYITLTERPSNCGKCLYRLFQSAPCF